MWFILQLGLFFATINAENFTETLNIRPLSNRFTSFIFNFQLNSQTPALVKGQVSQHNILRRSLAQVVTQFQVEELQIAFTRGRWDPDRFGEPLQQHAFAGGVEIVARLPEKQWEPLVQTLSGMFCATLAAAVKPTIVTAPRLTFGSQGKVFYAHLAQESACTENLTPWLKLLPCRHHSGLASLLKPNAVFDSYYSSMSLNITNIRGSVSVSQVLASVLDTVEAWDLNRLFKAQLLGACPLSQSSKLVFYSPDTQEEEHLIKVGVPFDLNIRDYSHLPPGELFFPEKQLRIERHLVDRVGLEGGLSFRIVNLKDEPVNISLNQVLPWFLQPWLHSLKYSINEGTWEPVSKDMTIYFNPAKDQIEASSLELKLTIPPNSTFKLHLKVVAKFLSLDQYPPDPNRGFIVGPAIATILSQGVEGRRYYSTNLVVFLPTPDFSMPYNVATFTSTIFALFFGSLFNSLMRQFTLQNKN